MARKHTPYYHQFMALGAEMVARSAPPTVRICALRPATLTRPIIASMPAGYRPGPAQVMIDVLQQVTDRWTAATSSRLVAA